MSISPLALPLISFDSSPNELCISFLSEVEVDGRERSPENELKIVKLSQGLSMDDRRRIASKSLPLLEVNTETSDRKMIH